MADYIGSETIKKYYKEEGIVLSDRMIAAGIQYIFDTCARRQDF